MHYRRLVTSDLPQLLALQHRNMRDQLTVEESQGGYLLTAFSADEFLRMDNDLCVIVAVNNGQVIGYLCANTFSAKSPMAFVTTMHTACQSIIYNDKPLTHYHAFVPSPLCIARDYRGGDVFVHLCNAVLASISEEYELAITCIAVNNAKSLAVANAVGFQRVGQFLLGDNLFWLLVYDVDLKN